MKKKILALALGLALCIPGRAFAGAAGGTDTTSTNSGTVYTTSTTSSAASVNVGNINLGNLVQGHIYNSWHNANEYYSYGAIQGSASVLADIASANGGTTATGLNDYVATVRSGSLPSNLELLTANLSSPSAWIYYTGEGGNQFQSPTSINGYDAVTVVHSMYNGRGAVYSDSLTPAGTQNYAIQATGTSTSTAQTTTAISNTTNTYAGEFSFLSSTNTQTVVNTNTNTLTTTYNGNGVVNVYQAEATVGISPIVLDLSHTGKLDTQSGNWLPHAGLTSKHVAMFDINGNGMPMLMEWLGPKNGLLVKPNADGTIDGNSLFGTPGGFENGYEKLALLDVNHDGVLSGNELKGLFVWVDTNQNARLDNGELKSLQSLKISSLDLRHNNYKSSFVMNGKTETMWDWWPTAVNVRKMRVVMNSR